MYMVSYAQFEEDKLINARYFKNKRRGTFIEIGARDGISDSVTKMFEDDYDWTGVLAEPNPIRYKQLSENRPNCTTLNCFISDEVGKTDLASPSGDAPEISTDSEADCALCNVAQEKQCIKKTCRTLTDIIKDTNSSHFDFLSLNVGKQQYSVLKSWDFSVPIDLILLKTSDMCHERDEMCRTILTDNGYERDFVHEDREIYVLKTGNQIAGLASQTTRFVIDTPEVRHKINNVFIINLRRRDDLWEKTEHIRRFFAEKNIPVGRADGCDFAEVVKDDPLAFNKLVASQQISLSGRGFKKKTSSFLREIGCFLSHKNCWGQIASKNLANTLILEDGILFEPDKFTDAFDSGLDMMYLHTHMRKGFVGHGSRAYVVSNEGATRLLQTNRCMYMPIDLQLRHLCTEGKLNARVSDSPCFTRDDDRTSSIVDDDCCSNDTANSRQDTRPLLERIITSMVQKNIPLNDHLEDYYI